ncbi:MAG: hypothetical protein JW832_18565 [Deltaproteobacteria bacterium]|nr:hypothetical protein [Deltaproteobacteria bacterium]
MRNALIVTILLLAAATGAGADTIFFKNGARLDIGPTWTHDGQVTCLMYGKVVGYPLEEVQRVEKDAPPANETLSVKPQTAAEIRRDLEVMSLHNRAVELARTGKTQEALHAEMQAYSLSPANAVVRATLGSLHNGLAVEEKNRGDLEGALEQLNTALGYAPQEPQIQKNIAVVYVEMARQAAGKNNIRQARALLDAAMEHDRDNPHCYALSGHIAYLENKYDRAEKDWARALELAPQLADVRERLERLGREKSLEQGFETRKGDNFSIKFESAHNRRLADSIMEVLRDAYRDVGRDFDLYPDWPVPVIVYSQAELGQLDYFPDWASGAYDGKIRFGENIQKRNLHMKAVLYHEYTHVLVRMAAGSAAPFWLNEGLAEYEARPFKTPGMLRSRERLLHRAHRLFTLSELAAMNIAALSKLPGPTIELAYAQSESFVTWLVDRYGIRHVRGLLARLGGGDGIEAALRSALNEELAALERQWRGRFESAGPQ